MSLTAEPDAADLCAWLWSAAGGLLLPFLDLGEAAPTWRGGWDYFELKQRKQEGEGKTRWTDKLQSSGRCGESSGHVSPSLLHCSGEQCSICPLTFFLFGFFWHSFQQEVFVSMQKSWWDTVGLSSECAAQKITDELFWISRGCQGFAV